jgi:hypothetical protein
MAIMARFGERRFRELRFSGLRLGLVTYSASVGEERGFKIVFYDTAGTKIGELGSDIREVKVSAVDFELQDFGCGAFSIAMDSQPSFTVGYRTRIVIHPYFDLTPWFSGFIEKMPKPGQTTKPFVFTGFGFYNQLDWVTVTASYATQDIGAIVADIVVTFISPYTQIIYNAAKVETVGYVLQSIDFDHVKAKDAIQMLAEIAQDYEFGVDNEREFFFRAIETDERDWRWSGKHFAQIEIPEDATTVKNRLYIRSGKIQSGGTNFAGSVQDAISIGAYGLREDVVTAPDILDYDDAIRWGNYQLSKLKDALTTATLSGINLDDARAMIEARGKMRVTSEQGVEYVLPISRVAYKISASGVTADLELGGLEIPFQQQILDMLRKVEEETRLQDKRTAQLF